MLAVSELYKKRQTLRQKLKQLEDPEVTSPLIPSPTTSALATSYFEAIDLNSLSRRRKSHVSDTKALEEVESDIISIAAAIEADAPLSFDQIKSLRKVINLEIDGMTEELKGSTKLTLNHYPKNLSLRDFYSYIPLPTVVYELE